MKIKRLIRALGVGGALMAGGGAGCGGCFVRGTRVLVPRGRRPIEELRAGDEVMSWSLEEQRAVTRIVSQVLVASATSLLRLRVGELTIAGVTVSHPFYDARTNLWVAAGELAESSRLLVWLGAGEARELPVSVERMAVESTVVHNLSVAGEEQTYFAEGVLVHNKSIRLAGDFSQVEDLSSTTCFVRGTRVLVPGGRREIETLRVGDEVMSWSLAEGRAVARPVRRQIVGRASALLRLRVGELTIAGVTAEHPLFDAASDKWVTAGELDGASRLLVWLGAGEARPLPVTVERFETEAIPVHNLSVGGEEQNYFAEGVLVHNKSPDLKGFFDDLSVPVDATTPADAATVDATTSTDAGVGDGGDGGD